MMLMSFDYSNGNVVRLPIAQLTEEEKKDMSTTLAEQVMQGLRNKAAQHRILSNICNEAVDEMFERRQECTCKESPMFSVYALNAGASKRFSTWLESITSQLTIEDEQAAPMTLSEACVAILTNPILMKKIGDWPDVMVRFNRPCLYSALHVSNLN